MQKKSCLFNLVLLYVSIIEYFINVIVILACSYASFCANKIVDNT